MRKFRDESGRLVTRYEAGDGIRRHYHGLLDPARAAYPRRHRMKKSKESLLSELTERRPLIGIYELAKLAEYMLWMSKFSRRLRGRGLVECTAFFAATRRAMQNVLSTSPISKTTPVELRSRYRRCVRSLVELGRAADEALKNSPEKRLTPSAEL